MPNKKRESKQERKDDDKVKFQGFLNLKLSKEEKSHIANNPLPVHSHGQLIADAAFRGYKISLTWNERQDCYILTAYGSRVGHPDAGYGMSIYHTDFARCFDVLNWCLENLEREGSLTEWLGDGPDLEW